jgi:Tol biopolymer transport system component
VTLAPGTRLGPYEILSPLGAGGMGEVYRARDTRLQREVAVKVLPSTVASDPDRLRRFEKESRAASALNHPAIVTIYDVGQTDGVSWIAMELVEGKTLRELLIPGAMPVKRLLQLAPAIAEGLARAHESGIAHRDLKPENVMVTKEGLVKILDFGLAKLSAPSSGSDQDSRLPTATGTSPGVVLGTVSYMSPEQASGQPVDYRSDQFALGSILYEMATGRKAFQKKTPVDTLAAILNEEPEPVGAINSQVPVPLRWVVERCMAKVPEERYVATRDLARELNTVQTHLSDTLSGAVPSRGVRRRVSIPLWIALPVAALLVAGGVYGARRLALQSERAAVPTFRRLTFRRGNVLSARFAPDGQTVVYGAAWEGKPSELFTVRTDSAESRPLGLDHANVLSVSSKGDLVVLLNKGSLQSPELPGTLARMPLGGGAPRELQEDVYQASWTPDGDNLAVTRKAPSGKALLEFPLGRPIEESFSLGMWFGVKVSPGGDKVAFCEWDNEASRSIWVADRQGQKRALINGLRAIHGFAWSPRTGELFFIGRRQAGDEALLAVSMSGSERVVWPGANGYILHDIAPDGRLLIERYTQRRGVIWVSTDGAPERELGWLDSSSPYGVSRDGSQVLFAEDGEGGGLTRGVFIRRTDGSPAVRLGDGTPMSLSPDGKWVLALTTTATPEIVLLPTGAGSPRKLQIEGLKPYGADFVGEGSKTIAFYYSLKEGEPIQLALVGIEGGHPRTISLPDNAAGALAFSQDGTRIVYADKDRRIRIAPVSGGTPVTIPGATLESCETIDGWSRDIRYIIVSDSCGDVPDRVTRINVESGQRTLWKEIQPADRTGVIAVYSVSFTSDQVGYAYGYTRMLASDLYLVEGLK